MSTTELVYWLLSAVLLATAAAQVTGLLVQDEVPFGPLREWITKRWPPEHYEHPTPDDPRFPPDPRFTGAVKVGSKIGTLITCYRCMGVWVTGAWTVAWWVAPRGTLLVAVPFGAMTVQRWWNSRI